MESSDVHLLIFVLATAEQIVQGDELHLSLQHDKCVFCMHACVHLHSSVCTC